MEKLKVLFVCTGNTCRSPMAAVLAKEIWAKEGVDANVYSAGIHADGLMPASRNSISAMAAMGHDISAHKSQTVTASLMRETDVVLTMTEGHKQMLTRIFKDEREKIFSLAEYSGSEYDVDDPFGMDAETYAACARQIKGMVEGCTGKIKEAVS